MDVVPETQAMQDVLDPRFSIQSPLRCYGPGSLDRGQDTETNSRIAIRWLPIDAGGESASLKVSQLPVRDALPRIHAKGKVGSLAYFAMDFPEGKLMAGMLGAPLETEKVLRIGIDIADALATTSRGWSTGSCRRTPSSSPTPARRCFGTCRWWWRIV
jgi:hypothetical protein